MGVSLGEVDRRYRRAPRLAIVTSHVIQYQAPLFRALASDSRVIPHVFFLSRHGAEPRLDTGFGAEFEWDVDLLGGYQSEAVPNLLEHRPVGRFASYANPSLIGRLARARPEAVIFFGLRNPSSLAGYLYARVRRTPCLYRAESSILNPASWATDHISKRLLAGMSAVVPIGTANDRYYEKLGYPQSRRFLAPYTVDNERFKSLRVERTAARSALGIATDEFVVLMVSKLVAHKDPLTAVAACGLLRGGRPMRLLVVGDGELRSQIMMKARQENVKLDLRGFLNQSELGLPYSAADVFVLPSLREPWGLVVNEAMQFSLPVIVSSRVGAGLDLVVEGENGSVFPVGSARELARRLQKFADSPQLAEQHGKASRAIIDEWNVAATVEGFVRATHSVIPSTL